MWAHSIFKIYVMDLSREKQSNIIVVKSEKTNSNIISSLLQLSDNLDS